MDAAAGYGTVRIDKPLMEFADEGGCLEPYLLGIGKIVPFSAPEVSDHESSSGISPAMAVRLLCYTSCEARSRFENHIRILVTNSEGILQRSNDALSTSPILPFIVEAGIVGFL
jgi:hypothetical protein